MNQNTRSPSLSDNLNFKPRLLLVLYVLVSRHKKKCWSYKQIIAPGKQTSSTRDINSIIARRNKQNQSTLTSLRLERSPKLASLEP